MPRVATTSNAFNAAAEPGRREILNGDIVAVLGMQQPSVSKHLRVLPRRRTCSPAPGRQMFYRTNAEAIRPLQERTSPFERYRRHHWNRVKERAEEKAAAVESERNRN